MAVTNTNFTFSALLALFLAAISLFGLAEAGTRYPQVTLAQLERALGNDCPPTTTSEAITCQGALPYINAAIKKYGLKSRGQRAAYISNMAYESGNLKYNHNLVTKSQGTRSMLPAVSLKQFVEGNPDVQKLWPQYPTNVETDTIVDVLIQHKADFEPGAWWVISGPGCKESSTGLSKSPATFEHWERTCIFGGEDTIPDRIAKYKTTYDAIL
ncbi:hypothetical protein BGW38_005987 [Lunasporangiospora selenospora]|uniref:Uncharacterized protein n=1 Tax=Lunasporangiospora selenospora TaxID=979761 RepID=A0A9P6KH00_9FUNG|nr:hypothetical protein BGW38_005987 [Lunasporangiospora selenospora]